jgi:hypothetical protein
MNKSITECEKNVKNMSALVTFELGLHKKTQKSISNFH